MRDAKEIAQDRKEIADIMMRNHIMPTRVSPPGLRRSIAAYNPRVKMVVMANCCYVHARRSAGQGFQFGSGGERKGGGDK